MEISENQVLAKQEFSEELPPLFKHITSMTVAGFDVIDDSGGVNHQSQPTSTGATTSCESTDGAYTKVADVTDFQRKSDAYQVIDSRQIQSISISMPSSPLGLNTGSTGSIRNFGTHLSNETPNHAAASTIANVRQPNEAKFHSQPIPVGAAYTKAIDMGRIHYLPEVHQKIRLDRLNDKRFDSFKTWSGKLERQISHLRGRQQEPEPDGNDSTPAEVEVLPVDRYFAALEGPELDTLRASEELVLPNDKMWPFLLRFPVSAFGICLGVSSQAILWKTLAISASTSFLHVSLNINLVLWCISVALMIIVSSIYSLKVIFYFEAVRREYYHPVRVNFFFAPWIALLFLALSFPPSLAKHLHSSCWYILMAPILCLELKIYGQWMSGGQRRLSKVANPTNHLSIVGNFAGALLGASMGLKEGPIFFFAVGLAHYVVLFVTLYQRLPTNQALSKELHPVFFLFVAAPSIASMAWARIQGSFDHGSRIAYFIALFLYCSLAVRINFFRGFRFSLAWWAYTFPMTGASVATIKYSNEVTNSVTRSLSVMLSAISSFTVTALFLYTIYHALVLKDLFPNDIAIAIAQKRPKKTSKKWFNLNLMRTASSETKDTSSLKSASSNPKFDIES